MSSATAVATSGRTWRWQRPLFAMHFLHGVPFFVVAISFSSVTDTAATPSVMASIIISSGMVAVDADVVELVLADKEDMLL